MHEYLLADPDSSTIVELAHVGDDCRRSVDWPAVADAQVLDAMAAPLCTPTSVRAGEAVPAVPPVE